MQLGNSEKIFTPNYMYNYTYQVLPYLSSGQFERDTIGKTKTFEMNTITISEIA